jgi:3-hydroxy-9,10-secoandrosta-1,3,5(10)-triene-9,17-dione monooxygenase reductase component
MIHVPDEVRNTIGKALGRIPSGVFILTAAHGKESTAMLASWVQQTSFQPPTVTISISKDRSIVQLIRASGKFAISVVPENDTSLMKRYARGIKPDEDAFAGMKVTKSPAGLPVFSDAVAWLECSLLNAFEFNADHDLYVAQVTAGQLVREGPSFTHQRGNGFHY